MTYSPDPQGLADRTLSWVLILGSLFWNGDVQASLHVTWCRSLGSQHRSRPLPHRLTMGQEHTYSPYHQSRLVFHTDAILVLASPLPWNTVFFTLHKALLVVHSPCYAGYTCMHTLTVFKLIFYILWLRIEQASIAIQLKWRRWLFRIPIWPVLLRRCRQSHKPKQALWYAAAPAVLLLFTTTIRHSLQSPLARFSSQLPSDPDSFQNEILIAQDPPSYRTALSQSSSRAHKEQPWKGTHVPLQFGEWLRPEDLQRWGRPGDVHVRIEFRWVIKGRKFKKLQPLCQPTFTYSGFDLNGFRSLPSICGIRNICHKWTEETVC